MKKVISIVTPFFNEEYNIFELYKRIKLLIQNEKKYDFEIIAVEHGSSDTTFKKLLTIHKKDKSFKILQLSRNFGTADAGISAGLFFAKGHAAIILMADLQEPPELISKFIRKWEEGYDVVNGVVKKRPDSTYFRRISSVLFYKVLNKLTLLV